MLGMTGINLPIALSSKLSFLNQYGVEFGNFLGETGGDKFTPLWIIFGFTLVLIFKNSMEQIKVYKVSYTTVLFSGILFVTGVLSMNKVSEFLYFNF